MAYRGSSSYSADLGQDVSVDPMAAARSGLSPEEGGFADDGSVDPGMRAAAARAYAGAGGGGGIPDPERSWGEYSLAEWAIPLPGDSALEGGLESGAARAGELLHGLTRLPQTVAEGVGAGEWWEENAPEVRDYINEAGIKPIFGDRELIDKQYENKTYAHVAELWESGNKLEAFARAPGMILKEGLSSVPDMALLMTGPLGIGAYGAARTGEIAEDREAQGQELGQGANTPKDIAIALATVGIVTAIDKVALGSLVNKSKLGPSTEKLVEQAGNHWAKRVAAGAATEASTEAVQEHLEYVGTMVNEDEFFSDLAAKAQDPEAFKAAIAGAIIGGGVGAGVVGAGEFASAGRNWAEDGTGSDEAAAVAESTGIPALEDVQGPLQEPQGPRQPLPESQQLAAPDPAMPVPGGPVPGTGTVDDEDDLFGPEDEPQAGISEEDEEAFFAEPAEVVMQGGDQESGQEGEQTIVAPPKDPVPLDEDFDENSFMNDLTNTEQLERRMTARGQAIRDSSLFSFLSEAKRGRGGDLGPTAIDGETSIEGQAKRQKKGIEAARGATAGGAVNQFLDNTAQLVAAKSREFEKIAEGLASTRRKQELFTASNALVNVARNLEQLRADMKKFVANDPDAKPIDTMVGAVESNLRVVEALGMTEAGPVLTAATKVGQKVTPSDLKTVRSTLDTLNKKTRAELQRLTKDGIDTSIMEGLPANRDAERAVSPAARRAQEYIADSQRIDRPQSVSKKGNVGQIIDTAMLKDVETDPKTGKSKLVDPSPKGSEERQDRSLTIRKQQETQDRVHGGGDYTDYTRPGNQYVGRRDESGNKVQESQPVKRRLKAFNDAVAKKYELEEKLENATNKGERAKLTSRLKAATAKVAKLEAENKFKTVTPAGKEARESVERGEQLKVKRREKKQSVAGIRKGEKRAPSSSEKRLKQEREKLRANEKTRTKLEKQVKLDELRWEQAVADAGEAEAQKAVEAGRRAMESEQARLQREADEAAAAKRDQTKNPSALLEEQDEAEQELRATVRSLVQSKQELANYKEPDATIRGVSPARKERARALWAAYKNRAAKDKSMTSPTEILERTKLARSQVISSSGLGTVNVFDPAMFIETKDIKQSIVTITGAYPKIMRPFIRDANGRITDVPRFTPKNPQKDLPGYSGESNREFYNADEVEIIRGKRVGQLDVAPDGTITVNRSSIPATDRTLVPEETDSLLKYISRVDWDWAATPASRDAGLLEHRVTGPDEEAMMEYLLGQKATKPKKTTTKKAKADPTQPTTPVDPVEPDGPVEPEDEPDGPDDLDDWINFFIDRPTPEADNRRQMLVERIAKLEADDAAATELRDAFVAKVEGAPLADNQTIEVEPVDGWPFVNGEYKATHKDGIVGLPALLEAGTNIGTELEPGVSVQAGVQQFITDELIDSHIRINADQLAEARQKLKEMDRNEGNTGQPKTGEPTSQPQATPSPGPQGEGPTGPDAGAGSAGADTSGKSTYRAAPEDRQAKDLLSGIGPDAEQLAPFLKRARAYQLERADGGLELDDVQALGAAKGFRQWLKSQKRGWGGFANFDNTGFGKTRQIMAMADMIATEEAKGDSPRSILIMTEGKTKGNILIEKQRADAVALGIDPDATYADGTPKFVFQAYSALNNADTTPYAAAIFDEAHAVKGTRTWADRADALNTEFRAFFTATPTDAYGQELYYLKHLVRPEGGNAQKGYADLVKELGIKKATSKEGSKEKTRWVLADRRTSEQYLAALEGFNRTAALDGAIVSRTKGRLSVNDTVAVEPTGELQDLYDELYAKRGVDSVTQILVEYMKLDGMVDRATTSLENGEKVIAMFRHSNASEALIKAAPKKLRPLFQEPPIQLFAIKMGAKGNVMGGVYYGEGSETANPDTIKKFQGTKDGGDGMYNWIAVSDSKASTGLDLNDSYENGSPRRLMIAMTSKQGQRILQAIGRHDRTNNVSIPYTDMIRLDGNEVDINYRTAVDHKIQVQNAATNFRDGRRVSEDLMQPQLNEHPDFFARTGDRINATPADTDREVVDILEGNKGDSARAALLKIAETNSNPAFQELASKLLKLPTRMLTTKLMTQEQMEETGAFGRYDLNTRTIEVYPHSGATQTFLHEVIHHFTIQTIARNPEMARQLRTLMQAAGIRESDRAKFSNAFQDEYEFVSEAFTDGAFQRLLDSININGMRLSMWDRFVRWVKRALGVGSQTTSALDQVMRLEMFVEPDLHLRIDTTPTHEIRHRPVPLAEGKKVLKKVDDVLRWNNLSFTGASAKWLKLQLKTLTFNQIVDVYKRLGERSVGSGKPGGNIMTELLDVMDESQATTNRLNEQYRKQVLNKFRTFATGKGREMMKGGVVMTEGKDPVEMTQLEYLSNLMNISGYAKIHFGKSSSHRVNRMFSTPEAQAAWKMHKKNSMKAEFKEAMEVYNQLASYFEKQQGEKTRVMAGMYLDAIYASERISYVEQSMSTINAKLKELNGMTAKQLEEIGASKDALDGLKQILEPGRTPGAYFPLRRYGDWVVVADGELEYSNDKQRDELLRKYPMGKDDEAAGVIKLKTVARFETEPAAARHVEALKRENADIIKDGRFRVSTPMARAEETLKNFDQNTSFTGLLNNFSVAAQKQGLDGKETDRLKQTFATTLLDMMPESSVANNMREREGIHGADLDLQRTLTNYGASQGHLMANMMFSRKKADLLDDLRMEARDRDKIEGYEGFVTEYVRQELQRRIGKSESSTMDLGKLGQTLSDVGFAYYLVGASYNLVNMTQVPLVAYPHLAGIYGDKAASKALARSYKTVGAPIMKDLAASGFTFAGLKNMFKGKDFNADDFDIIRKKGGLLDTLQDPQHKQLIENMVEFGDIESTLSSDMARTTDRSHIDEKGRPVSQTKMSYMVDWMRTAPHITEIMNRSQTAIMAFELEFARSKDFDKAQLAARDAVKKTQFVYTNWNKPPAFQYPVGRVALMFKQHVQHMYFYMIQNAAIAINNKKDPAERKTAQRQLVRFIGMHIMAAGAAGGTPEMIKWAFNIMFWAFSDDDEPIEYDKWLRNALYDGFGQAGATFASQGLPGFVGMDLSGRIGIDSMLMYEGIDTSNRDAFLASIVELAGGPMASLAARYPDIWSAVKNRQFDRAAEQMLPKALKDPLVAIRHKTEGFEDLSGKVFYDPDNMTWWDFGQQFIGLQPKRTADTYAKRGVGRTRQSMNTKRRVFFTRFYEADSRADIDRVLKDIAAWNNSNPDFGITRSQLIKSRSERRRQEALTRKGVYVPNNKRTWADENLRSYTE